MKSPQKTAREIYQIWERQQPEYGMADPERLITLIAQALTPTAPSDKLTMQNEQPDRLTKSTEHAPLIYTDAEIEAMIEAWGKELDESNSSRLPGMAPGFRRGFNKCASLNAIRLWPTREEANEAWADIGGADARDWLHCYDWLKARMTGGRDHG